MFGNSVNTNGIRLNFWDKDVKIFNGISIFGLSEAKATNGISLGLFGSNGSIYNGFSISGFVSSAHKLNGIGIAGLIINADTLNGIFISASGVTYLSGNKVDQINGLTIGFFLLVR